MPCSPARTSEAASEPSAFSVPRATRNMPTSMSPRSALSPLTWYSVSPSTVIVALVPSRCSTVMVDPSIAVTSPPT
jgi:hypothetical protein